ncbi:MAG: hypothetical protein HC786_32975 [Richelia sp. CSU_2_1]|nr:hypothetical protein [Richelia sp. CSU_2_1]
MQAKFVPGSDRANRLVENNNNLAGEMPKPDFLALNPSSQTTVVQAKFATESDRTNRLVENNNNLAGEMPNPPDFLAVNPSSQITVVQAKSVPGSDRTLLSPKPTSIATTLPIEKPIEKPTFESSLNLNPSNLSWETKAGDFDRKLEDLSGENHQSSKPIVRGRSQSLTAPLLAGDRLISPGTDFPRVVESGGKVMAKLPIKITIPETIQNSQSPSQNSIDLSGLKTPLVFATPRVNAASVQAELAVQNVGIAGISKTGAIDRNTGLSKQVSANIHSDGESNVQQPNRQDSPNSQTPIDMEALTDKVERKLMQRLIIESERRGRKTWS